MKKLLTLLSLLSLTACSGSENKRAPATVPTKGIFVSTYEDQGRRLKTYNYNGTLINTSAELLDQNSKIYISDGLIAFTKYDQGLRVITYTKEGEHLNTAADLLTENKSKVWIGKNIIAFSLYDNGLRLMAYNSKGESLNTSADLLDDVQLVQVKDDTLYYLTKFNTQRTLYGVNSSGKRVTTVFWTNDSKLP